MNYRIYLLSVLLIMLVISCNKNELIPETTPPGRHYQVHISYENDSLGVLSRAFTETETVTGRGDYNNGSGYSEGASVVLKTSKLNFTARAYSDASKKTIVNETTGPKEQWTLTPSINNDYWVTITGFYPDPSIIGIGLRYPGGKAQGVLLLSENGKDWKYIEKPDWNDILLHIYYANDTWVITSTGSIYVSKNGLEWEKRSTGIQDISSLKFVNGIWFVFNYKDDHAYTSKDLITFVKLPVRASNVKFINGKWVLLGYVFNGGDVAMSTNGTDWDKQTSLNCISLYYVNGRWVGSQYWNTSATIITSTDGKNWSKIALPGAELWGTPEPSLAYGKNIFILANHRKLFKSANGVNWTEVKYMNGQGVMGDFFYSGIPGANSSNVIFVGNGFMTYNESIGWRNSTDGNTWVGAHSTLMGGYYDGRTYVCGKMYSADLQTWNSIGDFPTEYETEKTIKYKGYWYLLLKDDYRGVGIGRTNDLTSFEIVADTDLKDMACKE